MGGVSVRAALSQPGAATATFARSHRPAGARSIPRVYSRRVVAGIHGRGPPYSLPMSHRRRGGPGFESSSAPLGHQDQPANQVSVNAGAGVPAEDPGVASAVLKVLPSITVACMGALLFGYHIGAVNGPLSTMAHDLGFGGNVAKEGLVVSSTLIGAFGGSLLGGGMSDTLGPRRSLIVVAAPLLLGVLMITSAGSFGPLAAGRLITGIGLGISSSTVPTYIGEVAPTEVRGALGSLNQLMIVAGILGALVVNTVVPASSWRLIFALSLIPTAMLAGGMAFFCPDSPRYLLRSGRRAEAEAAALRLWGEQGAMEMMVAADADLEGSPATKGEDDSVGWGSLLWGKYRPMVLAGAGVFFFQQCAGINSVVFFSTSVFRDAGVTADVLASVAVGVTNLVGTLIATAIVDRLGRKTLLIGSFGMMGLSMCVLAAALGLPALASVRGQLAVAGTILYVLSFALGAGPVPGLLLPEIFPNRVRGKGVAIAMGMHWGCNFLVGQTFLATVTAYGISSVYTFFATMCFLACAFVQAKVVETKGRTLEDIEAELMRP